MKKPLEASLIIFVFKSTNVNLLFFLKKKAKSRQSPSQLAKCFLRVFILFYCFKNYGETPRPSIS